MNLLIQNVLIGIIASALTVLIIEIIRKVREYNLFKHFSGHYKVFLIGGETVEGEIVEFIYCGRRLFKIKSKLNEVPHWESSVVMNTSNPFHGEGVYSYLNKNDFGLHTILISKEQNQISVHFRNLSHRDGRYGGVLWRRIE
jgi:hypothetical protein